MTPYIYLVNMIPRKLLQLSSWRSEIVTALSKPSAPALREIRKDILSNDSLNIKSLVSMNILNNDSLNIRNDILSMKSRHEHVKSSPPGQEIIATLGMWSGAFVEYVVESATPVKNGRRAPNPVLR